MRDIFITAIVKRVGALDDFLNYILKLHQVLSKTYQHYEIIALDSEGYSPQEAKDLEVFLSKLDGMRYIRTSAALSRDPLLVCGLDLAIGDILVCLNLHTDPEEMIPELVDRQMSTGAMLIGVFENIPNSILYSCFSKIRAAAFRFLFNCKIPDHTTGFLVFNRNILNAVLNLRDRVKHIKAAVAILGYEIQTFPYKAKHSPIPDPIVRKILSYIDIIFSNSNRPLRCVALLALLVSTINLIYVMYIFLIALFKSHVMEGWITLSLQNSMNYFLISLSLSVGFEYLWRGTSERKKPGYLIIEEKNSNNMIARKEEVRNVVSSSL